MLVLIEQNVIQLGSETKELVVRQVKNNSGNGPAALPELGIA